jgi:hypothetical protein
LWPWSLICTVLAALLGTEMAIFGAPLSYILDINLFMIILFLVGQISMILAVVSIITAIAIDISS